MRRSTLAALTVGLGLLGRVPLVRAQDVVDADERAPRFLLASATPSGAPVRVDVDRTPVLRRRISVRLLDVPLAEALKTIANRSGLDLAYSATAGSLGRLVRLDARDITVAAALTEVLLDADIDVVFSPQGRAMLVKRDEPANQPTGTIVGRVTEAKAGTAIVGATVEVEGTRLGAATDNDGRYRISDVPPGTYTVRARYIGYAPGAVSVTVSVDKEATADFALEKSVQRLDEVVTTGTVVPTEVKALPTPISIVTGEEMEQKGYQRVDQIFRGDIPGAVAWEKGPGNDYLTSIALRGASALISPPGAPSIKTFIDGVEVADPIYIAGIDPSSVDRIEVTRGPQASTLYGVGALDGVMQLFTKKGRQGLTRPEVLAEVSGGGIGGFDGSGSAWQTDNTASVLGGTANTSYSFGGSYRRVGEWVPSYRSTNWNLATGAQTTQGPLALSASARYADRSFDSPWDTRFRSYTYYSQPFFTPNRVRQQTYGITASLQATRNWQHTVTVGYDQTYQSADQTQPRFTTPDDSLLIAGAQHLAKTSLLYHTDLRLKLAGAASGTVTAGVNHDAFDWLYTFTSGATRTTGALDGSTFLLHTPWTSTGLFGQVQVDLAERLFLTGGLRAERNPNFGVAFGTAWSPRVGAAWVLADGPATLKLRASYGESIRAPDPGLRSATQDAFSIQLANPTLAPERQRGGDAGLEVYVGQASFGMTYYDQRAIDLIQLVTIPTQPDELPTFQYQNLARVKNNGWEFEGRLPLGSVQVSATYSIVSSRVQELSPDYPPGSYQVGDRVVGIPRTSAGATITYSPFRTTTLTASMTHIGHWMNTDFVALYGYYYGGQDYRGSERSYWIEYPTVTRFRIGVVQALRPTLNVFVRAENVGNTLRYEQVNSNIPVPRSIVAGASARF